MRFELQTQKLRKYLYTRYILGLGMTLLSLLFPLSMVYAFEVEKRGGVGFVIGLSLIVAMGIAIYQRWYARQFIKSMVYEIDNHILHVQEGVFNRKQKAIPLDRVTDFQLFQGILMRWAGFWIVKIQTASQGEMAPEATLWAVSSPKEVRTTLLNARSEAVKSQNPAINAA